MFDRRFYAIVFQTSFFLKSEELIELSSFVPVGKRVRQKLKDELNAIKQLGNKYEQIIRNNAQFNPVEQIFGHEILHNDKILSNTTIRRIQSRSSYR